MGQGEKSARGPTPPGRLQPGNDFGTVPCKDIVPALPLTMGKPVDFLGIEGGQPAGHPLPSKVIFFRIVTHVSRDGVESTLNAKIVLTGCLHEFSRVPETNRQKLDQANRVSLLPRVVTLLSTPLDEAGPARQ